MALSNAQLTDLQSDLGIGNDEAVFTDDELDRLYARATENYALTVVLGIRQILINVAKRYDYQAGQTNVKAGDVFDNLYKMLTYWENELASTNQVRIVGLRPVPTLHKDRPSTSRIGCRLYRRRC